MPESVKSSKKIEEKELIEYSIESAKISISQICTRCSVIIANKDDNVNALLKSKKMEAKHSNEMMYVCRYKLVKKTVYELLPVTYKTRHDNEIDNSYDECSEDDDNIVSINLSAKIEELYLSTTSGGSDTSFESNAENKKVTPFKIKDNSVHKLKRRTNLNGNGTASNNESYDDDEHNSFVHSSPNKKSRVDATNQNYSPAIERNKRYLSHEQEKHNRMTRVRKNLNTSFSNQTDSIDNISPPNSTSNYTSKIVKNGSENIKLVIQKENRTPLKDNHDNNKPDKSPHISLRNKILDPVITSTPSTRRSILKPSDGSAKSMYFLNLSFHRNF